MDERTFFDRLAPTWDDNEIKSTPEKINYILDFCDLKPGQSVLDLGTGTGVLLPYIASLIGENGSITAVDYSNGMLEIAEKKFSNIAPKPKFLNLDFENETIDGEFDRIFLYCVYPHLHEPFDTLKWLRRVNLKEKGRIIVAFPSSEKFINEIHEKRHAESDFLPPVEKLADQFREAGLPILLTHSKNDSYVIVIGE